MAALCEMLTLCGLKASGVSELQGLEDAGEGDRVLLTEVEKTVTLYKVSDQKPLGSWAVKQGQRVTCPAIYNHGTEEYVVVHDDKVLRVWKDEDVNFDKVFKTTLSAEVHRIHSLPDTEPVVLFRSGAVRYLDMLLADPRQDIENVLIEETIRWSNLFLEDGQPVLVYITEKDSDFYVNVWRPSTEGRHRCRLQPYTEDARVLHFSAIMKDKMVSLYVLYSTGDVCQFQVPLARSDEEAETILSMSTMLKLLEPADTGALIVLDDSHIATLTHSSKKQKDCLCIWNTSFQTLQDCKEFSQKTKAQLWNYHSKLFIPYLNVLQVVRYVCEPSSLAAALGKDSSDRKTVLEPVPIVNWEALIGNKTAQAKTSGSTKSSRLRRSQHGGDKVCNFQDLLSDVQTASISQISAGVQKLISSPDLTEFHSIAGKLMEGLVDRCRNNPKFYPQSTLMDLIMTRQLSYSLCPDLMVLGLEKSDVQLLQLCLQSFIDVPESVVCSCLKVFLSISEDVLRNATLNTESVESYISEAEVSTDQRQPQDPTPLSVAQNGFSPGVTEDDSCDVQMFDKVTQKTKQNEFLVSRKRAVLLNTVLITPFSEPYLLPHLKDLTSDQVILFLSYLQCLYKLCSDSVTLSLPGDDRLSITQVIDWMNLLLDANFTILVMLPKAKPLLYSLQKIVRLQMKLYSELNKIEGSLSVLKSLQRPREECGRYSIEVLELY